MGVWFTGQRFHPFYGAKNDVQHFGYILNLEYNIKHIKDIFDKPIHFVPILMQDKSRNIV